jgi:hypothetical protein
MERTLRRRRMRRSLLWILVFGAILTWSGVTRAEQKPSMAILPFFIERVEDPARGAVCPVCKGLFQSGSILPGSQNTVTRLLDDKMEAMKAFTLLPFETVKEAFSRSDKGGFEQRPVASSVRLGEELNVDFILLGYLFRFEERIGSSVGVEKPASVGFDLHLVRVRDGKVVWTGRFDETQRPLSEDIRKIGSFFRRGAVWLTAEELASAGMSEVLKKLPGVNELEQQEINAK